MSITLGNKEYFPGIGKIKYEVVSQKTQWLLNGTTQIK